MAGCDGTLREAGTDDLETLVAVDGKEDSVAKPAPAALALMHTIDLRKQEGRALLQVMMLPNSGIKANLDDDYLHQYLFPDWNTMHDALYNFDGKVVGKVLGAFTDRAIGLKQLTDSMAGKTFTPANIVTQLQAAPSHGRDVYTTAEVMAMAAGAGTLVTLDEKTYYYNYGYASGAGDVEMDVMTTPPTTPPTSSI
jgi:hypothetical protein